MGMISPKDGSYQPITAAITHDLQPARRASDVIAYKLADGSVVGYKEFQAYNAARVEILNKLSEDIRKLQEKANIELSEKLVNVMKTNEVRRK